MAEHTLVNAVCLCYPKDENGIEPISREVSFSRVLAIGEHVCFQASTDRFPRKIYRVTRVLHFFKNLKDEIDAEICCVET